MKKFFIAVVVSLLAICFSEEFKGFLGIEWGTERKVCLEAMKEKGWEVMAKKARWSYESDEKFFGKTYGGKKIEHVSFGFDESDCLRSVFITFSDYDDVDRVYDALIEKYNLGCIKGEIGFFTRDLMTGLYPYYGADSIGIRDYEYDRRQEEIRAKLQAERDKVDDSDL